MNHLHAKKIARLITSLITAVSLAAPLALASVDSTITKQVSSKVTAKVTPLAEPLVIAQKYSFQSKILGETRQFYLHLPAGYPQKGQQYPVLYIPDGKRKMQKTVAIVDDLAQFGRRIPNMIVVGIETNVDRKADLSTFESSVAFLNFINQELKPYINATYQTSGENLLMGSSMGGEFVLRALLEQPQAFDGYFAISPSVYYSNFQLVDKAMAVAKSKQALNKKLYLSVANEGWNQGVEEFTYHLRKYPIQGLTWHFTKLEQESHGSISLKQGYTDLQDYYKNWAAPHFANTHDFEQQGGLQNLINTYAQRNSSPIPIGILDHLALLYVDQQQGDQAIALSQRAVKEHPTSGRALRNLATVYKKLSLHQQALATYKKALQIAIDNNHKATSIESHRKALVEFKSKHLPK